MNSYSETSDFHIETSSGSIKMPSMHYHSSYELYYLQIGSREYFIEDVLFSVVAGDFVLIPPGKLHRTGGDYGVRTLVGFTHEFLSRYYTQDAITSMTACFDNLKLTPTPHLQSYCKACLEGLAQCKTELDFAIMLGSLLQTLNQCPHEEIRDNAISPILTYINTNFGKIENIRQIAEAFYISKFHLCRIFKDAMGMTLMEYLNKIRIKNAQQMLLYTNDDLSTIAERCGFHSSPYFCNVFKASVGQTPTQFRKRK